MHRLARHGCPDYRTLLCLSCMSVATRSTATKSVFEGVPISLNLASILRFSAQKQPNRPAMTIGAKTLNSVTLDGFARRFAGALHGLGLRSGQHVALMLPNVPHFTMAY